MPRRTSLPRRDGQGRRRRIAAVLFLVVSLAGACGGVADVSVDDADLPPRTQRPLPRPSAPAPASDEPGARVAADFDDDIVGEASGIGASVRNPGWVYVLDDGPGSTGVLAVDTIDGGAVELTVDGFEGRDTEGLAVAPCRSGSRRSCLYIGDIGNNQDLWPSVTVWRVAEPALRPGAAGARTMRGVRTTYAYAGRPIDSEALLVRGGRPLLITKERRDPDTGRTPDPHLLAARRWGAGVLRDVGPVPLPDPSIGLAAAVVGNVVTGGEAFGDVVVLSTYDHVVAYTAPRRGAPLTSLARWTATELDDAPALPQPEGVTIDGCGLWMVSERVDSIWLAPSGAGAAVESEEDRCPTGSARS
jgi:hypothetical protein